MDWTEKHRPRSLQDIVGNGPSVKKLHEWAKAWQTGVPEKRAVILAGPAGTGKTSAALALARDMGWAAIELNASDSRNAETIKRVATAGAVHQTFGDDGAFHRHSEADGRKLIILDEADNLYERLAGENAAGGGSDLSDKGGKVQIVQTIREARQPIVLIVNDLYALQKGSGAALRSLAETLKWSKVNVRSIPKALAEICRKEQVRVDPQVLEGIAYKAEGDLRAAVRDLESLCIGRSEVTVRDLESLGQRDTTASMFDIIRHILKGRRVAEVRRETMNSDSTPEDMVLWVDENMPKEYKHPEDLARAYERLSRADVFLGRTRSTQNYRLWAYAGDLATIGVMTAREHEYKGFTPYGFPQWLMKMSRSRGMRQAKDHLAEALGRATHQSKRKARLYQVEPFTLLFGEDEEFRITQVYRLDLTDEDVAILMGGKAKDKRVKEIREVVKAMQEEAGPKKVGLAWGEGDAAPEAEDATPDSEDAEKGAQESEDAEKGALESEDAEKGAPDSEDAGQGAPDPEKAEDGDASPGGEGGKRRPDEGQSTLFGF